METKRLVLAFALSAAVLIGWYVLFPPPAPPPAKPAASAAAAPKTAAPGTAAPASPDRGPGRRGDRPPRRRRPAPAVPVAPIVAAAAETVEVRQPLYTARLSNEGGGPDVVRPRRSTATARASRWTSSARARRIPGRTLAARPGRPVPRPRGEGALHRAREENGKREDGPLPLPRGGRQRAHADVRLPRLLRRRPEGRARGPRAAGPVGVVLGPSIGNPSGDELQSRYSKPGATITVAARRLGDAAAPRTASRSPCSRASRASSRRASRTTTSSRRSCPARGRDRADAPSR